MSDDLDDLLRRAMKNLDDQVPPGYFEDFPRQTLARLAREVGEEPGVAIAAASSADALPPAVVAAAAPELEPEPAAPARPRQEDSGLNDIRSLASSQRLRISSKRGSQSSIDPDEDLLAAASGGWKAVALPEPGKLPALPGVAAAGAAAAERGEGAGAVEPSGITPITAAKAKQRAITAAPAPEPRSGRRRAWIGALGLGVAAAAAAVLFISTQSLKSKEQAAGRSEAADEATPAQGMLRSRTDTATTPPAAAPAMIATEGAAGGAAPMDAGAATELAVGSAMEAGSGTGAGSSAPVVAPKPAPQPPTAPPTKGKADPGPQKPSKLNVKGAVKGGKRPLPDEDEEPKPVKPPAGKTVEKPTAKPDGKQADEPKKKPAPSDPDFDKLLEDSGYQEKKPAPPKLERKSLSGDDMKQGMSSVAAKVSACYAGQQGTALVKLTVAPTGKVQKVTVTGVFAGTPVGACVERAIYGAVFPPWDGASQSFGYSYLLSE